MDDDGWIDGLMNGWMMNRWIHYIYIYIYIYTGSSETFGHMLSPAYCSLELHSLCFKFLSGFLQTSQRYN